jgi:hypothetical protein
MIINGTPAFPKESNASPKADTSLCSSSLATATHPEPLPVATFHNEAGCRPVVSSYLTDAAAMIATHGLQSATNETARTLRVGLDSARNRPFVA